MITNAMASQRYYTQKIMFFLSLLLLVISACFCQYDPYARLLTTKEPDAADLAGTYVLKQQTLIDGNLDFLDGEQTTIEINKDGTFSAINFPVWQETDAGEYMLDKLLSTTGDWSLEIVGGVSNGGNDIKSVWGLNFSRVMSSASLTGKIPPHGLIFTYGDPDSGNVMIFEIKE